MTPGVKSGFLVLVLLVLGVGAQSVTKYFENNGTLVLDPKVSEPLTSITWKHKGNIVAEWIKNVLKMEYLGDFKGRSEVDQTTGVLTIRGIKKAEGGEFTVEINGRERPEKFHAVWIRNLKGVQVEVVVRPLTCSAASETCNLDCRGNFTGAGPVRFFWKKGDKGRWEEIQESTITIFNNEETKKIESFSCKASNPLGETEESKAEKNPLTQEASGGGSGGAIAGGIIVGLIVVAAVGVGGYFYHKRQQRQRLNVNDLENGSGNNAMDHSLSAMEQDKGQTEAASTECNSVDAQNAEEKRPLTGPSATENSNNKPEHEKPNHDS